MERGERKTGGGQRKGGESLNRTKGGEDGERGGKLRQTADVKKEKRPRGGAALKQRVQKSRKGN